MITLIRVKFPQGQELFSWFIQDYISGPCYPRIMVFVGGESEDKNAKCFGSCQ